MHFSAHQQFVNFGKHEQVFEYFLGKSLPRDAIAVDYEIIDEKRARFRRPKGTQSLRNMRKLLLERRFGKAVGWFLRRADDRMAETVVLALELSALFHQRRELVVGKDFWKILCHRRCEYQAARI